MTDLDLMQSIKAQWGTAIAAACNVSSVPASFLAALIANESGGNPDAKRFESHVLASLWEVLLGRRAAYGSIARARLVGYVAGVSLPATNVPASLPADAFQRVDALATSWSLTQIMGYHALEPQIATSGMASLKDPAGNLICSTRMLGGFAHSFQLDVTKDFEQMLRCWNGGHPTAQTFDPQYVPNGLARMNLWTGLT
jgi:hypothetical protein